MTNNRDTEKNNKTQIYLAWIALLSAVLVAVISNISSWRKDSAPVVETAQPAQSNTERNNDARKNGDTKTYPSLPDREIHPTLPSIDLFLISGRIEDENGTGIGSVQVKSGSIKVRSDAQGRFEINLPFKSMTDELILTFEKEGFETYHQSFNRSQSQLTLPVTLKKKN